MSTISATWLKAVEAEEILQRSSQVLSVVDGQAYVFGGELRPREPRDNDVHVLSLDLTKGMLYSISGFPPSFLLRLVSYIWQLV